MIVVLVSGLSVVVGVIFVMVGIAYVVIVAMVVDAVCLRGRPLLPRRIFRCGARAISS